MTSDQTISVVIPCLNERDFIGLLLEALANQDVRDFEVIVADGGSIDGTIDLLLGHAEKHTEFALRIVENPCKSTPAGLNCAIRMACGQIIVRLDGHSRPTPNYLRRCREVLFESGAEVVGGAWTIRPSKPGTVAGAIALGVASIMGAGNALYRLRSTHVAQDVDTVPFGCFRKATWQRLEGYNQRLLSNEDYEFNLRVRKHGGRVRFDPSISCEYFARPTLLALAKQYWRYGWWKAQMLKSYPASLKLRQAIPTLWVLTCICLPLLSLFWMVLATPSLAIWSFYVFSVCLFSAYLARLNGRQLFLPLLAVFPIVHFAWGIAFWMGLLGRPACIAEKKK